MKSQRRTLVLVCAVLSGCAHSPRDPFEPWNRATFALNEALDDAIVHPVATHYSRIVPEPVRRGIANMSANPGDATSAINGLLQGHLDYFLDDVTRFGVNTSIGLLGFFDVASEMSIESHHLNFSRTLRTWGVPAGPYIVLPLLGPSTLRSVVALPLDSQGSVVRWVHAPAARLVVAGLDTTSRRAQLLPLTRIVDDMALDKYLLVRDGFLQREGVPSEPSEERSDTPQNTPTGP
ncbi:VacJ family lipoprotein [Variovorax sp. LjRoot84]|uniref:MlaA family lipoprotein n=1 Tax=Variovorax sp. LjRoot84 TaxID=3342340 RepID=UPI003ED0324D